MPAEICKLCGGNSGAGGLEAIDGWKAFSRRDIVALVVLTAIVSQTGNSAEWKVYRAFEFADAFMQHSKEGESDARAD